MKEVFNFRAQNLFLLILFRDRILRSGLIHPSMQNFDGNFFGGGYENNFDIKFLINFWAWLEFLLLLSQLCNHYFRTPKHQKFRHFPSFCQNGEIFVNSGWMKKNKSKISRNTIKSNCQTHNTKLLNLHREEKKRKCAINQKFRTKKWELLGKTRFSWK